MGTTASKTPTKNKEQKNIISEDKKQVQNSPLREPNRIKDEDELSLDSPIEQTKKARKRIESSSEEENGSPKKESPEKTKTTGTKRKSSPSLSASKSSKKTKDEKEE